MFPNGLILKDYQQECVETIDSTFKNHKSQLVQLPTGSGKTVIFLSYLKQFNKKAIITCPTRELLYQIQETSNYLFGKENVYINNGHERKDKKIKIYTSASLYYDATTEFLKDSEFDVFVIDEAHHAQSSGYKNFIHKLSHRDYNLLGLTATPERHDQKSLLQIFDVLSFERNLYHLIKDGYLVDLEGYRYKTDVKINPKEVRCGDFQPIALEKLDIDSRNDIIFKVFKESCHDKKTIIFCLSVLHSKKIAELLRQKGFSAESIDGSIPRLERQKILDRFEKGQTTVLCNCQLLTEGFDEPSIEAMIIARPTKSKTLYTQMIGRGVRPYPGKEVCYVHELTDNCHNICSFNSAAGNDVYIEYDYSPGTRFTDLSDELKKVSVKDVLLQKERIDILEDFDMDAIYKSSFHHLPATPYQMEQLQRLNIETPEHPSFIEAAFLDWKKKALIKFKKEMEKNGYHS